MVSNFVGFMLSSC